MAVKIAIYNRNKSKTSFFHILPLFAKNKNNIHCLLVHIKIIYMSMILLQFRINHISFFIIHQLNSNCWVYESN